MLHSAASSSSWPTISRPTRPIILPKISEKKNKRSRPMFNPSIKIMFQHGCDMLNVTKKEYFMLTMFFYFFRLYLALSCIYIGLNVVQSIVVALFVLFTFLKLCGPMICIVIFGFQCVDYVYTNVYVKYVK
jgi:hypothetical protein